MGDASDKQRTDISLQREILLELKLLRIQVAVVWFFLAVVGALFLYSVIGGRGGAPQLEALAAGVAPILPEPIKPEDSKVKTSKVKVSKSKGSKTKNTAVKAESPKTSTVKDSQMTPAQAYKQDVVTWPQLFSRIDLNALAKRGSMLVVMILLASTGRRLRDGIDKQLNRLEDLKRREQLLRLLNGEPLKQALATAPTTHPTPADLLINGLLKDRDDEPTSGMQIAGIFERLSQQRKGVARFFSKTNSTRDAGEMTKKEKKAS